MKAQSTKIVAMLLAIPVLCVGLLMLNGCKDSGSEPSADSGQPMQEMQGHEGHDHAQMAMTDESAKETVATAEQTLCPVMGNPINKDLFVEYQGKKVYFCCPACKPEFEKDPAKYVAKLPQFQK
ncbi:MAG: YHS domain-containing protein [Planctomycetota bacterium]